MSKYYFVILNFSTIIIMLNIGDINLENCTEKTAANESMSMVDSCHRGTLVRGGARDREKRG